MLQFHLLGPLEVWDEQRLVAIPRRKPRALLAALLLQAGEVVSADRLIDDLWHERAPPTAKVAVQNYVSFLRKLLGPETVGTRPSGYLLQVEPDQVDLRRFERLAAEACADASREKRAATLREALALWRGPPLADLAFEPFVLVETPRLEELRRSAYEELIDAELALGRHAQLLPEVEALVGQHPFDERLRAHLMLILYRVGRQADALEAYRETRRLLVDELGIEPSPQLRDLEQSILRQDPALVSQARIATTLPVRKTVTVLFADLVDSTTLTEQLDPEALRELLDRTFAAMRGALEGHGGTVEKFIGDAVLAVFGVPAAHEDDALRAVRAAVEMRDELAGLSDELERERGLRLRLRIGVDTGEVFAGGATASGEFVTGAAVSAAKRLEEAAPPGEVVLGAATLRLVRDAVRVEPGELLRLHDDSTVGTWRLLGIVEGAPAIARRLEAPLVGRQEELTRLRSAFEHAREERRCQLLVLAGEPGIGKTRLARELLRAVSAEATVLTGACASYGEGATWLPLAEMVHQLGDLPVRLAGEERGEIVAQRIEELVGLSGGSPDETAWAFRRLFETLAATRPLVLVIEDIQWADPGLLDLIEYVAASSSGAPIFLLCTTRPDLFDARPTWAPPRPSAALVVLEPLADEDSEELVDALAHELPPAVHARVVATAEGNPLFLEQLLVHLADDPEAESVPPTIQAVIAARIDRLRPDERAVVQRGSVEGRLFHRGAVNELLDDGSGAGVAGTLLALARKEFVRADHPLYPGDDGFRFNHVLIRDVAYASMPKELRSRLHVRLADWLEARSGHVVGHDEIVGYHLEQAYRLGAELGRRDDELALRAGRLLRRAGEAALGRYEASAATALLRRANDLLAAAPAERAAVLTGLGLALRRAGSLVEAERCFDEAIDQARRVGDELAELRASIERGHVRYRRGTAVPEDTRRIAQRGIDTFRTDADLAGAWELLGGAELQTGDYAAQLEAMKRSREHAIASGDIRRQIDAWLEVGGAMLIGRTPLAEVKGFGEAEIAWAREHGLPALEADALLFGYVDGLLGDLERGWAKLERARSIALELGILYIVHEAHSMGAELEVLAGDLAAAERELRRAIAVADERRSDRFVATYRLQLARVLNEQGRHDDASVQLDGAAGLLATSAAWKVNRARVLAARGQLDEAVALAREAAEMNAGRDNLTEWALRLVDFSEVLRAAGDRAGAEAALVDAIALNEEKGNIVAAQRCRERRQRLL